MSGAVARAVQSAHGQFVTAPALAAVQGSIAWSPRRFIKESLGEQHTARHAGRRRACLGRSRERRAASGGARGTVKLKADAERVAGAAR